MMRKRYLRPQCELLDLRTESFCLAYSEVTIGGDNEELYAPTSRQASAWDEYEK